MPCPQTDSGLNPTASPPNAHLPPPLALIAQNETRQQQLQSVDQLQEPKDNNHQPPMQPIGSLNGLFTPDDMYRHYDCTPPSPVLPSPPPTPMQILSPAPPPTPFQIISPAPPPTPYAYLHLPPLPKVSPTWGGYIATAIGLPYANGCMLLLQWCIPPSAANSHEDDFQMLGGLGDILPVDAIPECLSQCTLMEQVVVFHPSAPRVLYTFTMADDAVKERSEWAEILEGWPDKVEIVCVMEKKVCDCIVSVAALFAKNDDPASSDADHLGMMEYLVAEIQPDGVLRKHSWRPRSAFVEGSYPLGYFNVAVLPPYVQVVP